jgi:hypothetical protein
MNNSIHPFVYAEKNPPVILKGFQRLTSKVRFLKKGQGNFPPS